jgi:RecB family exonuclease
MGLEQRAGENDATVPAAIAAARSGLFRADPSECTGDAEGIRVVGMPECEGEAIAAARAVRDWLDRGIQPSDIEVCVPRWGDVSRWIEDAFPEWGIAVRGRTPRPLATDSAVAALLLSMRLPVDDWPRTQVVQLLRHGRLAPAWEGGSWTLALVETAASIRDLRVFRGSRAIRNSLARQTQSSPEVADRLEVALKVFDHVLQALGDAGKDADWNEHVEAARAAVESLGLMRSGDPRALDALFLALEEHGEVRHKLDLDPRCTYGQFYVEVSRIARELDAPEDDMSARGVTLTILDHASNLVPYRIVAGLAEGTLPAREALELRTAPRSPDLAATTGNPVLAGSPLGKEMRRFLDLLSVGTRELVLIYPTTDEKGQALLAAGFLNDVKDLFTADAWSRMHRETRRLDPVLPKALCGQPREQRVRAVALRLDGKADEFESLARSRVERPVLEGVSTALRVSWSRARGRRFGPFDGWLQGSRAMPELASSFDSSKTVLSPSQLESFALCPFQFFMKYIVRVEPPEEYGALDDDFAGRGQVLHEHLEKLHERLKQEGGIARAEFPALVRQTVESLFEQRASGREPPASDIDAALRRIEDKKLQLLVRRYVDQLARYAQEHHAEPDLFEVEFGRAGSNAPALELRRSSRSPGVRLRGKIDRIDLERGEDGIRYRVIDYKTGAAQSPADIKKGLALQLALYTVAAEELILREEGALPTGAAYWNLAKDGFEWALPPRRRGRGSPLPPAEEWWPPIRDAVVRYVEELADRMRSGAFPVAPRKGDCDRTCEFKRVCRIRQVRPLEKSWEGRPELDWADSSRS